MDLIDRQGGFQALEAALNSGRSQVIVFPADWPRFLPQLLARRTVPSPFGKLRQTRAYTRGRHWKTATMTEAESEIPFWAPAGNARPGSRPPCAIAWLMRRRISVAPC